jgi:hypothetical protein
MGDHAAVAANAVMTVVRAQMRRGKPLDITSLRHEVADIIREALAEQRHQDHDEIKPDED